MTDDVIDRDSAYGFVGWADAVYVRLSLGWTDFTDFCNMVRGHRAGSVASIVRASGSVV